MVQISRWSHLKIFLMLSILAVSIVACDDSDDEEAVIEPQTTHNEKLNGGWGGEDGADGTTAMYLLYNGEIYISKSKNGQPSSLSAGTYTYTKPGDAFTATVQGTDGTIDISGTATEKNSINATYTNSNGDTGSIEMGYFDASDNASSLELLSGHWTSDQSNVVIDAEGGFTGTFLDTCKLTGTFSIIDTEHNLYILDADLTECSDKDGQFDGLTALTDIDDVENGRLIGITSNQQNNQFLSIVVDRELVDIVD